MREDFFIPYGILKEGQRRMMTRKKYADLLEEEPVSVPIGGEGTETYLLRPLDNTSQPKSRDLLGIITMMKAPADWKNLVPLMFAMKESKRGLAQDRWEWVIRRAAEADALHFIMECAKQHSRTGLRLSSQGIVQKVFFALHQKARAAEFQGPSFDKACRMAIEAVELMETRTHRPCNGSFDAKQEPFVVGLLLELSAARALEQFGGTDKDGSVRNNAVKLIGTWNRGHFSPKPSSSWSDHDRHLQEIVPIWYGIKLALDIGEISKEKNLSSILRKHQNTVGKLITELSDMAPADVQASSIRSRGFQEIQFLMKR